MNKPKKTNIHIILDDKFIDWAYDIFENVFPEKNVFVLPNSDRPLYLKRTKFTRMSSKDVIAEINSGAYENLLFHFLSNSGVRIINQVKVKINIVWIGWGSDYYKRLSSFESDFYLPLTLKAYRGCFSKQDFVLRRVKTYFNNLQFNSALKRIHVFSPVIKEDFDYFVNAFNSKTITYRSWNYGFLEEHILPSKKDFNLMGDDVLVGNSADFANNHLDIFECLRNILGDRKVYCPLSYGNAECKNEVLRGGSRIFGSNFIPLVHYMHLDEYFKTISTCSNVIIGALRQNALGNIITMMYFGAKIFLYRSNPVYSFFKRQGANIFTIEELIEDGSLLSYSLSNEMKQLNREILLMGWSKESIQLKTLELLKNKSLSN
jgi:dTDP-N-acetylfucosamine:lipid II N-acetylfucosaminyltransferase